MSKLTLICVLLALAYVAKAEVIEPVGFAEGAAEERAEGSPDEKSLEPSEPEGKAPEDSAPKPLPVEEAPLADAAPTDAAPEDISDPFGIFALFPEDIMEMRSDPSTGTVVRGSSSSKSSSMKMVNGVLVKDEKNEQTIVNDGQTVTVTNSSS